MNDVCAPVELLICTKCKRGTEISGEPDRPGTTLFESLAASDLPEGVTLTPVECLQNCDRGCSVPMRGCDLRWTYVYGNLHEVADTALLLDAIMLYRNTDDGLIPWRQRPEHLKRNCIARIPPLRRTNPAPTDT